MLFDLYVFTNNNPQYSPVLLYFKEEAACQRSFNTCNALEKETFALSKCSFAACDFVG